ncbi:hypothetical protein GGX14DRAFT_417711 [Mycena pura]|uniref:MYND-type domain-containing protein n=1 Tax=Mycena pura TaxID=153505 RepID=A0AAD6YR39_9AGAR|nr:hypothetical protein GGX14DRAFT_417711 [Mycena pura]
MPPASSNTISLNNGRKYKLSDILPEVISLGEMLVSNAHLKAASPLPADTDLSESEQKEVQDQITALSVLPPAAKSIFWSAFAAKHLPDIAAALRQLSHATQHQAISTAIQILSLMPDPKQEPYFRKFLRNSAASKDLPTIIANAFATEGTAWKPPASPFLHCTLIIHTLFWCDPSLGDDGKASIDASVRTALAAALNTMLADPRIRAKPLVDRVDVERLLNILNVIDSGEIPGSYYLDSTREYLEGQIDMCSGDLCDEDAELSCSKCKTVRYCGEECQSWHWKNGHKARCFTTEY